MSERATISSSDSEDEVQPEGSQTPNRMLVTAPGSESSQKTTKKATPGQTKRPLEAETETPRSKKARVAKRNVLLWQHFEVTDDKDVVICIANASCRQKLRRPDGSTSGMTAHFKAKHPVKYTAYLEAQNAAIKDKVCNE
jgi:hypothetical protein